MRLQVLTLFLYACCVAQQDPSLKLLAEFTAKKEGVVDNLARKAAKAFQERTRHVETCTCSRHSCSNEIGPGAECSDALGSLKECGACGNSTLDYTSTAVLLAPGSHPKQLSAQVRESLCTYSDLAPDFKDLNVTTWTYVASVDGTFRSYPVRHQRKQQVNGDEHFQGCSTFDPRVRPWYIAASTGPKDVVVVVDISGSMSDRWELTKKALLALLDTFTFTDYVNVVVFSDDAKALVGSTPLLAATPENLETLRDALELVEVGGDTDFNNGFQQAFKLLIEASKETTKRISSGCTKVVIFLTDGFDCSLSTSSTCSISSKNGPEKLLSNIEKRQVELKAISGSRALVFTFSMGQSADDAIPKQIACANDAAWSFFKDGEDPLLKLNSYYTFLAAARYPGRPTWITPFEDAFGLGRLTSVAKPVYSPNGRNGTTGALIGVVGHDVELKELGPPINVPSDVILEELASLSRGCDELKLGGCQLQVQRDHSVDHATCPDRLPKKSCYEFRRRWYKRFNTKANWTSAKKKCLEKGGKLVSIRSDEHLSFIASLSAAFRSWVGGRTSRDRRFSWENDMIAPPAASSDYWALSGKTSSFPRDQCAWIDPRGVKRNMDFGSCDFELSFICEFDSKPKFCKGSVATVDPDSFFEVPPLSQCRDEEDFLGRLRPVPAAESMRPSQALCPLGEKKNFRDLVCCEGCR